MKLRASTKILIGFVGVVALVYGGNLAYTKFSLRTVNLDPIPSGDVCLLAINKDSGVTAIVANQMAQIVEVSNKFGGSSDESSGGGQTQGSVKRRIPVLELVGILNGDEDSVSPFVKKMREASDDVDVSEDAPLWTMEDIEKAIAGDATLKTKLEQDLDMTLDGVPKATVNRTTFFNGIRVKVPINLDVPNAKGPTIKGYDIVNFKPRFMTQFYKSMREKFYDKEQLQQYYSAYLKDSADTKEDIVSTLRSIFSRAKASEELQKVVQIGKNTKILVNRPMITGASMKEDSDGRESTYDLTIHLSPEGRSRLWKFSSEGGTQLLVVSKGVAIAAATIGTQLNSDELVVKQIPNKTLVQDVVDQIQIKQ